MSDVQSFRGHRENTGPWLLPVLIHRGLVDYIDHGHLPGDFLTAVLTNDLKMSVGRADEHSLACLSHIVGYLYNECPSNRWGSEEAVYWWMETQQIKRALTITAAERAELQPAATDALAQASE